jgi:hypothetical protein
MITSYIAAAGIAEESKSWLFRTSKGWMQPYYPTSR